MYKVIIKSKAEKYLSGLQDNIKNNIIQNLELLQEEPRHRKTKKLKMHKGYRIRVGNYRILYTIDDENKIINIYSINHRKDVYS